MSKISNHQIWKIIYFIVIGLFIVTAIYFFFLDVGEFISDIQKKEHSIANHRKYRDSRIIYDFFNFIHLFSIPILSIILKARYSIKLLFLFLWFPLFFSLPRIVFLFF